MPKVLFNPTDEDLSCQYVGEDVMIKAGHKIRVDDPRGRQVLNTLFPRGLCELEYGDEGEAEIKKAEAGRQRNHDFKRKQVMNFNALNDQRIQLKQSYLVPDPVIKRYANELGMKLFEPYSNTDEAKKETVALRGALREKEQALTKRDLEVKELSAQVAELTALVGQIVKAGGQAIQSEKAIIDSWPSEFDEIARKIKSINRNGFGSWVATNFESIMGYPEGLQAEIRAKYTRMYGIEFPASAEDAATAPVG